MIVFSSASSVSKTKSVIAIAFRVPVKPIAFDYRFAREKKAYIFCQIQTLKIHPLIFEQIGRCFWAVQVYSHLQGDLAQYSLYKYRKINLLLRVLPLFQTIEVLGDRSKQPKSTFKTSVLPALPLQKQGGGE